MTGPETLAPDLVEARNTHGESLRTVLWGALIAMTFIVVPASAFPGNLAESTAALLQGVLVHMVCVGLPIAFITRRFASAAHIAGER